MQLKVSPNTAFINVKLLRLMFPSYTLIIIGPCRKMSKRLQCVQHNVLTMLTQAISVPGMQTFQSPILCLFCALFLQSFVPTHAHHRFTNCTLALKTPTCFGAEAPSSRSFKYKGAQAPVHQSRNRIIHCVVCLTTGLQPLSKEFPHRLQSSASLFSFQYQFLKMIQQQLTSTSTFSCHCYLSFNNMFRQQFLHNM